MAGIQRPMLSLVSDPSDSFGRWITLGFTLGHSEKQNTLFLVQV